MKWVFLLAIILAVPGLVTVLKGNPRNVVPISFALGASLLILAPQLWAAPIPWPTWQGTVKGIEVSFVDAISLAILLSTKPVPIPWWIKGPFWIFCSSLVISTLLAPQWMPSAFYAWQLLRSAMLFLAIARICNGPKEVPIALIAGLGLGLVYEALLAIYQYHTGDPRPGGNLGHSNFLGIVSDFVVFPVFGLALGTRRFGWPLVVVLAGFASALVGGSRATLGLFAAGIALTLLLSLYRGSNMRKVAFSICICFPLVFSPVIVSVINHRSQQALVSSDADRAAMKDAARMIFADHPFGVGANEYVIVANTGGYSQRAGVPWNTDNRAAPVHDTYYLVAAELGFIGLIGFVATLAAFVILGFNNLKRMGDDRAELIPGLLATMIIVAIHISYEWVFMNFMLHYMFAVGAGVLLGVSSAKRRNVKAPAAGSRNTAPCRLQGYS